LLQELGPSDVDIHVVAPVARPVDIEVHIDPDTPEIRDNINDELISMFRRSAVPGSALDDFILSRGLINDAISIAVGSGFFSLNLPADDIVCGPGEIATLGTVTYI
jgi:uncharacterized phage protein gp47/JayE